MGLYIKKRLNDMGDLQFLCQDSERKLHIVGVPKKSSAAWVCMPSYLRGNWPMADV